MNLQLKKQTDALAAKLGVDVTMFPWLAVKKNDGRMLYLSPAVVVESIEQRTDTETTITLRSGTATRLINVEGRAEDLAKFSPLARVNHFLLGGMDALAAVDPSGFQPMARAIIRCLLADREFLAALVTMMVGSLEGDSDFTAAIWKMFEQALDQSAAKEEGKKKK